VEGGEGGWGGGGGEGRAGEGGALDEPLLVGGEPVDPRGDQRLQGLRNALRTAAVPERMCDLLEEQRIALRPLEHTRPFHCGHLATLEERVHQLLAFGRAERSEVDRARTANAAAPRGTGVEQLGPGHRDDQDWNAPE